MCNGPALRKNPLREGQDKFKAISDEEEDTTFRRLALKMCLGRLPDRWILVGKFQETNLTKKKGKVSGKFTPAISEKKSW